MRVQDTNMHANFTHTFISSNSLFRFIVQFVLFSKTGIHCVNYDLIKVILEVDLLVRTYATSLVHLKYTHETICVIKVRGCMYVRSQVSLLLLLLLLFELAS